MQLCVKSIGCQSKSIQLHIKLCMKTSAICHLPCQKRQYKQASACSWATSNACERIKNSFVRRNSNDLHKICNGISFE